MKEKEYIFENYCVNYVFKNFNMASNQQQLNEQMVVQCVQQLAKTIEHNPSYLMNVRDGMEQTGYNTMAHMFTLIKS